MKKGLTAGIIGAFVVVTGGIGYASTHLGPPILTEENHERLDKTVNAETVDFYHSVCQVLTPVTDTTSDKVLEAAVNAVGAPDEGKVFADAQAAIAGDYRAIADNLPKDAPTEVYDPTKRGYGTYAPLIDRLTLTLTAGQAHITAAEDSFSETQDATSDVASRISRDVSALGEFAPLTSTATREAVEDIEACSPFFTDPDHEVHEDVVTTHLTVSRAVDSVRESLPGEEDDVPLNEALAAITASLDDAVAATADTPVAQFFTEARAAVNPEETDPDKAQEEVNQAVILVTKAGVQIHRDMPIPNEETQQAIDNELNGS